MYKKNNTPLVSVIVPNYNHARFLDERMESILGQTFQNFEVIILDDLSTDNSREVIEKYRNDPHVSQIVYNEQNSGLPFGQWFKGINLAKGEIIWLAESDDSCDKCFLERLVDDFVKNKCVFAFSRLIYMNEDGTFAKTGQSEMSNDYVQCWDGKEFIREYLSVNNIVTNASGCIFDKETALKVDHGFEKYKGSGDWLFWIEMAEMGNVCFDSRTMNYFRQHGNNTTAINYLNGTDMIEDYSIFQYCLAKRLITKNEGWKIQRRRILDYRVFPFDSEKTRKKVLKIWRYSGLTKLRIFLWRVFSSLASRV